MFDRRGDTAIEDAVTKPAPPQTATILPGGDFGIDDDDLPDFDNMSENMDGEQVIIDSADSKTVTEERQRIVTKETINKFAIAGTVAGVLVLLFGILIAGGIIGKVDSRVGYIVAIMGTYMLCSFGMHIKQKEFTAETYTIEKKIPVETTPRLDAQLQERDELMAVKVNEMADMFRKLAMVTSELEEKIMAQETLALQAPSTEEQAEIVTKATKETVLAALREERSFYDQQRQADEAKRQAEEAKRAEEEAKRAEEEARRSEAEAKRRAEQAEAEAVRRAEQAEAEAIRRAEKAEEEVARRIKEFEDRFKEDAAERERRVSEREEADARLLERFAQREEALRNAQALHQENIEKLEADKKAYEEQKIAEAEAKRIAEEERIAAEKKAEEERLEAERKAEEERLKAIEEEKLAKIAEEEAAKQAEENRLESLGLSGGNYAWSSNLRK